MLPLYFHSLIPLPRSTPSFDSLRSQTVELVQSDLAGAATVLGVIVNYGRTLEPQHTTHHLADGAGTISYRCGHSTSVVDTLLQGSVKLAVITNVFV